MARPRSALAILAVVLAVGYVGARPHLETVYVEETQVHDTKGETPWGPYNVFRSEAQCRADAAEGNSTAPDMAKLTKTLISYRCRPLVRFAWGW